VGAGAQPGREPRLDLVAAMKVRPFYRWYDLYVGIYVDRHEPALYLVVLGFGLKVTR
jgi:hypothetical protein